MEFLLLHVKGSVRDQFTKQWHINHFSWWPKCLSVDDWVKNIYIYIYTLHLLYLYININIHTHQIYILYIQTHTQNCLSAMKKNEILPFVTTWIDLGVLLKVRQVRQRKTNTTWSHVFVESRKTELAGTAPVVSHSLSRLAAREGATGPHLGSSLLFQPHYQWSFWIAHGVHL